MTTPPYIDIGAHERTGREARPRPVLTGVAAVLDQARGVTWFAYPCAEGVVSLWLPWKVGADERRKLDELAEDHDDGTAYALVGALASLLRCDLEYELTREVVGG